MHYTRYDLSNGGAMPFVGSLDRFKHMYLAYEWTTSENFFVMERYAMVQTYIWGCLTGHEDDWEAQEQAARQLAGVMPGTDVMGLFESMKSYIIDGLADEESQAGGGSFLERADADNAADSRWRLRADIGHQRVSAAKDSRLDISGGGMELCAGFGWKQHHISLQWLRAANGYGSVRTS